MASQSRGRSPEKAPSSASHKVGDKVMALWPGSSLYYSATVDEVSRGKYTVRFENDSTAVVGAKNVRSKNFFSSRKGSGSRSRSRSPSRRGRSRSRSRSPARQKPQKRAASQSPSRSGRTSSPRKPRAATPVRKRKSSQDEGFSTSRRTRAQSKTEDKMADSPPATSPVLEASVRPAPAPAVAKKSRYEFLGPAGVAFMMLGLPSTILALYLACNKSTCSIGDISKIRLPSSISDVWDLQSFLVVLSWLALVAALSLINVGKVVYGQTLSNGTKLAYRINGFFVFLAILTAFGFITSGYGSWFGISLPLGWVYDHYLHLAAAAALVSLLLSLALYAYSFRDGAILASGGNTGNALYDFFVGRELNPRIGSFDLKVFCELRPGLIAWVLINFCLAWKQYELHGSISNSMVLVCFFQFLYVADGIYSEESILTTMDIIHDGFGFMLAFGDLAWVPFIYTLQARYLVDRPVQLPTWAVPCLVMINMLGFLIFRLANSQKNEFRQNPNSPAVQHLRTLPTSTGRMLLVDGWWRVCRHPNYLGDLMMGFAWCATCGIQHIIPYFYIIYFTILLIHRQRRDDIHCRDKYGVAWDEYERIVPYRILPGIY